MVPGDPASPPSSSSSSMVTTSFLPSLRLRLAPSVRGGESSVRSMGPSGAAAAALASARSAPAAYASGICAGMGKALAPPAAPIRSCSTTSSVTSPRPGYWIISSFAACVARSGSKPISTAALTAGAILSSLPAMTFSSSMG